jgi:hypothetical protein
MGDRKSGAAAFLSQMVAQNDLVMVKVMGSPRPQTFRALLKRVYTARKGIDASWLGSEIEFVGCPAHWGQVPLAVGDTALLFVKKLSNSGLYEAPWLGHMLVEEVDGDSYAIRHQRELWLSDGVPASIRDHSRQDPKRSNATAIRFDALEAHLLALIEQESTGREMHGVDRKG